MTNGKAASAVAAHAAVLDKPWRRPGASRYALQRLRSLLNPPVTVTPAPGDVAVDRDVAVPTRDGTLLRANVFRPRIGNGPKPVIVSVHPYGKDGLPKRRGWRWSYSFQYRILRQPSPVKFSALTGWEAPDPAWWVAQGFVVVNADLRGCGSSDGTAQLLSQQEGRDTADLVQWAGAQPWSDGRVVMLGVSYLAISQYAAAAERPSALRAIVPWEGFTDPTGISRCPVVCRNAASSGCGARCCAARSGRPTTWPRCRAPIRCGTPSGRR